MKGKLRFFLAEFVMVMCMMFMCGCSTVTEMRSMTSDTSVEAEYFDQKSQRYVTGGQKFWYDACDNFKHIGLGIALFCMVVGFVIRRRDRVNAVFRRNALILEVGVPLLYVIGSYLLCFWVDRFVG